VDQLVIQQFYPVNGPDLNWAIWLAVRTAVALLRRLQNQTPAHSILPRLDGRSPECGSR